MRSGGILALDCGRRLGWAAATEAAVLSWPRTAIEARQQQTWPGVAHGTFVLGPDAMERGRLYAIAADHVADLITVHQPRLVAMEAPVPRIKGSIDTSLRLLGLAAVVELVCYRREVELVEGHIQSVKKSMTGHGFAGKADVVAECVARGFRPDSEDAADAIALLDHAAAGYRAKWTRRAA